MTSLMAETPQSYPLSCRGNFSYSKSCESEILIMEKNQVADFRPSEAPITRCAFDPLTKFETPHKNTQ